MSLTPMTAEQVASATKPPAGTATSAPAPAVTTTPEVAAEPKTLEALKAARRATVTEAPKDGEGAKTEPPKPGKTTKTVDVKVPDEKLETFKKLNSELTEARAKLAALEGKAPNAEKVEKATKLIEQGKAFDAIIDLVGLKAFNAAVSEVTGATDKKPPLSDEEKARNDEIETLKRDNASTKEQLAIAAAAQREVGVSKIIEEVKTLPQFVYLARNPEWVREALAKVDKPQEPGKPSTYDLAEAHSQKTNGRAMNDEEKNALIRAALEVAEEDHASRAKLYGAPESAKTTPAPKPAPRTIDRTMRGNVTKIVPHKKSATLEELKRERRQGG
jgi:hypothetical protein